jgi:purine-binding chemotaxis protein CheW
MDQTKQYCTFFVGDHYFGVNVTQVQEVIRYQQMTRIPLSVPEVAGLINLRGQIVTAIDLHRRLELPALPEGRLPMNVVVRTDDQPVSLLVDEIGDVVDAGAGTHEPVPETLTGVARQLVSGVHKLQDRLLLILDVAKAVAVDSVGAAQNEAA